MDDGSRQSHALLHAGAQSIVGAIGVAVDAEHRERGFDAGFEGRALQIVQAAKEAQCFARCEARVEANRSRRKTDRALYRLRLRDTSCPAT